MSYLAAVEPVEGVLPVARLVHDVPRPLQPFPDDESQEFLVVDHQDAGARREVQEWFSRGIHGDFHYIGLSAETPVNFVSEFPFIFHIVPG
jgi:hypothetical protein